MKSIIKNSKHFEPVKEIKGSKEMEGRGTWVLGASNAKDVSSSYLLHSPSWVFSSSFLASYCSFLVLHILHQVVGANISSVQIALQTDAKAAVKIYHLQNIGLLLLFLCVTYITPSCWCKYIPRANRTAKRC